MDKFLIKRKKFGDSETSFGMGNSSSAPSQQSIPVMASASKEFVDMSTLPSDPAFRKSIYENAKKDAMMELQKKKYRDRDRSYEKEATAWDLFGQLPIELIQTIFLFLIPKDTRDHFYFRYQDTKEAAQTTILSKRFRHAWSTFPDLYFSYLAFCKFPMRWPNANEIQDFAMAREEFANYVLRTITRYQQHNISIRRLHLTARLQDYLPISMRGLPHIEDIDDRIANILDQSIRKAKENVGLKEVHLQLVSIRPCNLLQTIFALKQLVSLYLYQGDLVKKNEVLQDSDNTFINCSSLRVLKLYRVVINEAMFQKLIHACPFIERIRIYYCEGLETIQMANLPNLKRLHVKSKKNQIVDVNSASLELFEYGQEVSSPYMLNIGSSRNLKILKFVLLSITDAELHSLIAKCPVLEELTLNNCEAIQKINISSYSLSFLSIIFCNDLTEVKIDAPNLNMFEYRGTMNLLPSVYFANGFSEKRKSSAHLSLDSLEEEASPFLELSKFLMAFKHSDIISLTIDMTEEFSFDRNIMDGLRDEKSIPEFDEVYITTDEDDFITVSSPSSKYSTLMEGLLWSFSPKIVSVKRECKGDDKFIMYLCEELLVERNDLNRNISTSTSNCWRNYFKRAKFKDRDDEWRPLHSWKSLADVLENLEGHYILNLSHD